MLLFSHSSGPLTALRTHIRFLILTVTLLCLGALVANALAFNFAIICIQRDHAEWVNATIQGVDSSSASYPPVSYTTSEGSWLFSAVAIGGLMGILYVPSSISRLGLRVVLTSAGALTSTVSLLLPLATAHLPFWLLFLVRVTQGLALAYAMPSMLTVAQWWAPPAEHAAFLAILSCCYQIGIAVAMPVSGWLCDSSWRWPATFYVIGGCSAFIFTLFWLVYRDRPADCRLLSTRELVAIDCHSAGTGDYEAAKPHTRQQTTIPYRRILTDPVVWATVAGFVTFTIAYQPFAQFGPIFMNEVLHFKVSSSGVRVAIPALFMIASKLFVASPWVQNSSWLRRYPKAYVIWLPAATQALNVVWYSLLALMPVMNVGGEAMRWLAQLVICAILVGNGVGFVGLAKNVQIVSL